MPSLEQAPATYWYMITRIGTPYPSIYPITPVGPVVAFVLRRRFLWVLALFGPAPGANSHRRSLCSCPILPVQLRHRANSLRVYSDSGRQELTTAKYPVHRALWAHSGWCSARGNVPPSDQTSLWLQEIPKKSQSPMAVALDR
jgi:hypothetical protein